MIHTFCVLPLRTIILKIIPECQSPLCCLCSIFLRLCRSTCELCNEIRERSRQRRTWYILENSKQNEKKKQCKGSTSSLASRRGGGRRRRSRKILGLAYLWFSKKCQCISQTKLFWKLFNYDGGMTHIFPVWKKSIGKYWIQYFFREFSML